MATYTSTTFSSTYKDDFADSNNFHRILFNSGRTLQARELTQSQTITQKEIEMILFIKKYDQGVSIASLKKYVWKHNSNLETHTVETHIYRLRKKIIKSFKDESFILSTENGYKSKKKRNPIARSLLSNKFKQKIVKPKKGKGSFKRLKN